MLVANYRCLVGSLSSCTNQQLDIILVAINEFEGFSQHFTINTENVSMLAFDHSVLALTTSLAISDCCRQAVVDSFNRQIQLYHQN